MLQNLSDQYFLAIMNASERRKKYNRLTLTRLGQIKAEFSAAATPFAAITPDDSDTTDAAATPAASASHFAVDAADDRQRDRQHSEGDDEDDGDDEFELAVRPTQIRRQNVETRLEKIQEIRVALE